LRHSSGDGLTHLRWGNGRWLCEWCWSGRRGRSGLRPYAGGGACDSGFDVALDDAAVRAGAGDAVGVDAGFLGEAAGDR
jgi:hypothetical protein